MPENSVITDAMKKAVGKAGPSATYPVEKWHIKRFAEAVGDENILFTDEEKAKKTRWGGVIATPTFLRCCVSLGPGIDHRAESGLSRSLDGGSEWEYFEPIRPGDEITVTSAIAGFQERDTKMGRTLFTTTKTTYKNQRGQVVATQTTTGMLY